MTKELRGWGDDLYTVGGGTLLFSELVSGSTYKGYIDLGVYSDGGGTVTPEFLKLFNSASGKKKLKKSLAVGQEAVINLTALEPNVENVKAFFYGGDVTSVAAVASATSATATGIIGATRDLVLDNINVVASSIVVTYLSGTVTTTATITTDYTVETKMDLTAIRWVDGGSITQSSTITVAYDHSSTPKLWKSKLFDTTSREGKAIWLLRSDAGVNMKWIIPRCELGGEGDFSYNSEDWTGFNLKLDFLEDNTDGYGYIYVAEDKFYS